MQRYAFLRSAAAAALLMAIAQGLPLHVRAATSPVDLQRSHATFGVSHLFVSKVTGRVPLLEVSIEVPQPGALPTSVRATLDPKHIDSGDGDRDKDLQGPDWFDTARFPTWTFASTKIVPGGGGAFGVEGVLTVHGVGQNVTLHVVPSGTGYHATTVADRHGFGMTRTRTDGLVGSTITIDLEIQPPAP